MNRVLNPIVINYARGWYDFPLFVYTFENFLNDDDIKTVDDAIDVVILGINDLRDHFRVDLENSLYGMVFPWSNGKESGLDYHLYRDFGMYFGDLNNFKDEDLKDNWQSANPTVRDYSLSLNGDDFGFDPNGRDNSCETTTIIRGIEGLYRRRTNTLFDYLDNRPKLPEHIRAE